MARIEAIASWAEMLRDTMAGSAGLEQAIIATAPLAPAPIRVEVVTLAVRLEGERLTPALRAFADEVADPTGVVGLGGRSVGRSAWWASAAGRRGGRAADHRR